MVVRWLKEVDAGDVDVVGGKAASLGELVGADLPVPPGFVVTGEAYRTALETAGIDEELFSVVDVDEEDTDALRAASSSAETLIREMSFSKDVRTEIEKAYEALEEPPVAVRSSATAEDLPDASFAGQQDTFLNVTGEDLLRRVKDCWASLFTQRAIYYRNRQGFPHDAVNIAVVVQEMVDADKSGVLFTSHPSTGEREVIIEAAWGLGEAVVSGTVSPDNYVADADSGEIIDMTISTKTQQLVRDPDTGQTTLIDVPDDQQEARTLTDDEISRLVALGQRAEGHYGGAQDIEWAIQGEDLYLLQSRPITTIERGEQSTARETDPETAADDILVTGLGASPGTTTGPARIIEKLDHLDQVREGDILVTEMTMPDMVPAMQRAVGLITDEGGMTSHAAIVSRELGVPAVVGTGTATTELQDGQAISIDGDKGLVKRAESQQGTKTPAATPPAGTHGPGVGKPMTATEVKVNVSIPAAAERAAGTGADGVGLLRIEHMILSLGKTPERYIEDAGERAYQDQLVAGIRTVAEAFYPRPVRVRSIDAPTDEFREMTGGEKEPIEHNPMLGFRGLRRSLEKPDVFRQELTAFHRLHGMGYDNLEIMFPLVNDAEDVLAAREHMSAVGIDPEKRPWGVMIETPASALRMDEIAKTGIDFVSFGTNDLTQYTLAVDRNNAAVADRFDELHPAVMELLTETIGTCREHDVSTSICGEAASKPEMVRALIEAGISSLSPNIDAVGAVQQQAKRVEQRLLLEHVR